MSNTSTGTFQGYDISGPITLRLLLTTFITNETGFHPDQVLFESEPIVVPHKPFPESPPYFDYIEVDLPEVLLQPSTGYAFVLDAASDLNLDDDVHAYMTVASTRGFGSEMFWNARVLWEQTGGMIGPRSEHFSQVWYGYDESLDVDMAFRITLVPEPSTWTLSLVAVGSVIWLARRRANAR